MSLGLSIFFLISIICIIVYEFFKIIYISEYIEYLNLKHQSKEEISFFQTVENGYLLWLILIAFYHFPTFLFIVLFSFLFLHLGFEKSEKKNWKEFFIIIDVICSVIVYIYFLLTLNF